VTQEEERNSTLKEEIYYYKNKNGFLVYAIIKCATEQPAIEKAERIIVEESAQAGNSRILDHCSSWYKIDSSSLRDCFYKNLLGLLVPGLFYRTNKAVRRARSSKLATLQIRHQKIPAWRTQSGRRNPKMIGGVFAFNHVLQQF
jgi:hypothetical protein